MVSFAENDQCPALVAFAEELADAARLHLVEQRSGARFVTKSDASPVTEFDRDIELHLRELIRARYPEHGIAGEEFPPEQPNSEFVWVIDPIDGTKAFVAGIPTFTTLVALCQEGIPVIGIIDASVTDERWIGVDGCPTLHNGREVATSGRRELAGSTVAWSNPEEVLETQRRGRERLDEATAWRVFGAGSYAYGRLASGSVDIAIESGGVIEADILASVPIVNGAGGHCSDGFGNPIRLQTQGTSVAAATPELHAEVIRVLNSARE